MIRNPYGRPYQPRRLQFPVPEDIFASDDDVTERDEKEIRSPAIDKAIDDWNIAKEAGDESGLRTAARAIVASTSAAFRLQGVPIHAHPVLPPQFVKAEAAEMAHLPEDYRRASLMALLDMFDPSARLGGMQQLKLHLAGSQGALDPDSPEARRRADELDRADPLAAMAHPLAYGGDAAMADLFGEEGMLGDWGWRRTVPSPSSSLPRFLGEGTRFYLESGPLSWGRLARTGGGAGAAAKGSGAAAKGGSATDKGAAAAQGEASASRAERAMGKRRQIVCNAKCHCYAKQAGADCPPFVYGTGEGPTRPIAWAAAERAANATVPSGCQKRHCHGPCK